MNQPSSSSFRVLLPALAGAALLFGASSLRAAHDERDHDHDHDRGPDVRVGVSLGIPLPHGYAEVRVGHDNFYYHRGMYYRNGPHGYYVVHAPLGARIRELPPYCSRIFIGGLWYWRYDDVYYRAYDDGYVVVESPVVVGATTATVAAPPPPAPVIEQSVWVGDKELIFKNGQFFRKTPDGLVWVEAPLGAITRTLPADATSVWYQGTEYFECDEVYFVKTPNGYEVIHAPWKK